MYCDCEPPVCNASPADHRVVRAQTSSINHHHPPRSRRVRAWVQGNYPSAENGNMPWRLGSPLALLQHRRRNVKAGL
jgi:hypothetical protein